MGEAVTFNDILTLIIAAAAVAVPAVAIVIGIGVDQRSTRSALTDLTLKMGDSMAAYDDLAADKKFLPSREIETLVLQAEFMMKRLTTRKKAHYPQSPVAATLAMALDKVNDFRWSDKYWSIATKTAEGDFKVIVSSYWAAALCYRGEVTRGRDLVNKALAGLPPDDADSCIVKADVCLTIAQWDNAQAVDWVNKAKQAYLDIPDPERRQVYSPNGVPMLNLQGFDFSNANLRNVNLADADLTIVNFTNADLTGANLTNTTLTNATLTDAIFADADLTGAVIEETAVLPTGWERDSDSGRLKRA